MYFSYRMSNMLSSQNYRRLLALIIIVTAPLLLISSIQAQSIEEIAPLIPTSGQWSMVFPTAFRCTYFGDGFASDDYLQIVAERSFTTTVNLEYWQFGDDPTTGFLSFREYVDPVGTIGLRLGGGPQKGYAAPGVYSDFDVERYQPDFDGDILYSVLRVVTPEHIIATNVILTPRNSICRSTVSMSLTVAVPEWTSTAAGIFPTPPLLQYGESLSNTGSYKYAVIPLLSGDVSIRTEGDLDNLENALLDAQGQQLEPRLSKREGNARIDVYALQTRSLYTYAVTTEKSHTITAFNSDLLNETLPVLSMGATLGGNIAAGEQVIYAVPAEPGQTITIQSDSNDRVFGRLVDAAGFPVTPFYAAATNGQGEDSYVLTGWGPYRYIVRGMADAPYQVKLTLGSNVREDRGLIQFGEILTVPGSSGGYVGYQLDTQDNWATGILLKGASIDSVLDSRGNVMFRYAELVLGIGGSRGRFYLLPPQDQYELTFFASANNPPATLSLLPGVALVAAMQSEGRIEPFDAAPEINSVRQGQPLVAFGLDGTSEWVFVATIAVERPESFWLQKAALSASDGSPMPELPIIDSAFLSGMEANSAVEIAQCVVSSTSTVNLRSGPGTEFDVVEKFAAGQTAKPVGRTEILNGMVWWKLENGTWVRSDVVNETGDCQAVPVVSS